MQWSLLGILLAGKNVFDAIGLPLPGFWPRNMAAQGPTAIFVHMIGNQLSDQLMHSNDFDVLVDGKSLPSNPSPPPPPPPPRLSARALLTMARPTRVWCTRATRGAGVVQDIRRACGNVARNDCSAGKRRVRTHGGV